MSNNVGDDFGGAQTGSLLPAGAGAASHRGDLRRRRNSGRYVHCTARARARALLFLPPSFPLLASQ